MNEVSLKEKRLLFHKTARTGVLLLLTFAVCGAW